MNVRQLLHTLAGRGARADHQAGRTAVSPPLLLEMLEDRTVLSTLGGAALQSVEQLAAAMTSNLTALRSSLLAAAATNAATLATGLNNLGQGAPALAAMVAPAEGMLSWMAGTLQTLSGTTPAEQADSGASSLGGLTALASWITTTRGQLATGDRPIDEVGNNLANPTEGTANTDLLRISPVAYADGISAPSLHNNPSARVISDILNNQADPNDPSQDIQTVDGQNLSDFGYAFGQFIDHDLDLTPTNPNNTLQILADPNDPSQMGNQTFQRSVTDPATGTSTSNPAQQINAVTSYLDLSNVYGSNQTVADALRTFSYGQLKTSPGNMLPYDNLTYFTQAQINALNMANDAQAVPESSLFAAGDVRANENVELTALQTLFVRNHNHIAAELQKEHPTWSDEQLYQEARKINIAEYQYIIYNQYLPDLLGPNALPAYTGYNPNVDPAIATEFSTVAFRFGHSLLSNTIQREGNNGLGIADVDPNGPGIDLAQDFFDPNVLNPQGVVDPLTGHTSSDISAILKGDADGNAQASDLLAINEVRDLLFANGGLQDNGQDLIARDVERARDDGIGSYNQVREAYGLPPVTSFAQITSNVQVQQELQKVYGNVNNIDPFEGGMAEDHMPGSDLGPLFTRIIADQFDRLRAGDRFFYLNEQWTPDELNILRQGTTLAKVIEANTNITNLQSDVFVFKASISGTVLAGGGGGGDKSFSTRGLSGITIQLQDTSGDVLATTVTDAHGHYSFNQQSGPSANPEIAPGVSATGYYVIRLVLPAGFTQTSANPSPILISRGDDNVSGVNLTVTAHGDSDPATSQLVGIALQKEQSSQSSDPTV
jgi:peroxidase